MSSPEGPFARFHQMAHKMLRDGGVYRAEDAYRRSISLEERLGEAERGLLGLQPSAQRDRVSSELAVIRAELRSMREDSAKESGKARRRHGWSVGLAVGGIVVGFLVGLAGILVSLWLAG